MDETLPFIVGYKMLVHETSRAANRKITGNTSPWWKVGLCDYLDDVTQEIPSEAYPIAQFRSHGDAWNYAKSLAERKLQQDIVLIF